MTTSAAVLVIGSGAAGLSCALRLAEAGQPVDLVCKGELASGSTLWAQGGISAVLGSDDSVQEHVQDTLVAGAGLCDEAVVQHTVAHGPEVIHWLIERGVAFTRDEDDPSGQRLHLTREGGHSHRRIAHAADATGRAVETTLAQLAAAQVNIRIHTHTMAVDLIVAPGAARRVTGAWLLDVQTGAVRAHAARAVVLATGGANQVYLYSSNPQGASGDGIAMAWRAGCRIRNMEFMQFHPTGLDHRESRAFLISEALRGEGAILTLPDGERFMPRFDARAELAPRDVVARAIDHEMKRLGLRHMLLDIRHRGATFIRSHFPTIHAHCLTLGLDITRTPIPVVPIAHFTCGGIVTDLHARTDLPGLYAIGEVACTGLHGANRMASNSLLECLVFARNAAADVLAGRASAPSASPSLPTWRYAGQTAGATDTAHAPNSAGAPGTTDTGAAHAIRDQKHELRTLMWNDVGIVRTTARLLRAQQRIARLQRDVDWWSREPQLGAEALELRNLVTVAALIVRSALARHESRGLHWVLDHPQTAPLAQPTTLVNDAARAQPG